MFSGTRFWTAFILWWLVWILLHTWTLLKLDVSLGIAIGDGIISNGILAIDCFALTHSLRFYRPDKKNALFILIPWALILSGLTLWISYFLLSKLFNDYVTYQLLLNNTLLFRYCINFLIIGCFILMNWVWYYIKNKQLDEERNNIVEKTAIQSELQSLRQQLQPHFLFNSLNSINALISSKPQEAQKMVQLLSDFLRSTVKKDQHQLVKFSEEIKHLKLYLEIEKVRFAHRLKIEMHLSEDSLQATIPSLLLQPVIENAIKFGLYDTTGEVTISIKSTVENKILIISIINPYDPSSSMASKGTGFGLESIKRRLYLLFKRNDLLTTSFNNNEYITVIKTPQVA